MIRLAILFAIFLAVYPMIGEGWEQFSTDVNLNAVIDWVGQLFAGLSETVSKLKG